MDFSRIAEIRGEVEHFLVQKDFMRTPGLNPATEWSIPGASKNKNTTGQAGYADVVDLNKHDIYEIKPDNLNAMAVAEAIHYAKHASAQCGGVWQPGNTYKPNSVPIWPRSPKLHQGFELRASQGGPGAILYRWKFDDKFKQYSEEFLKRLAREQIVKEVLGKRPEDLPMPEPSPIGEAKKPPAKAGIKSAKPGMKAAKADGSSKPPIYVPAYEYAPVRPLRVAPEIGDNPSLGPALEKDLAVRLGRVPTGTMFSILAPPAVYQTYVGSTQLKAKIKMLQVQDDPVAHLRRDVYAAINLALATGLSITFAVGAAVAVFAVADLAAAAAAAAAAASQGYAAFAEFLRSAAAMAAATAPGGAAALVFGVSRTAFAASKSAPVIPSDPMSIGATRLEYAELPPDAQGSLIIGAETVYGGQPYHVIGLAQA